MDEHGIDIIDAVEWAGGIWLAGTGRNSGSCPSGRGGRRGLLGRKQQDSATPPDVADSYSANLGLIPIWAKGNERKPLRIRKAKGKMAKERRAKARERTGYCDAFLCL